MVYINYKIFSTVLLMCVCFDCWVQWVANPINDMYADAVLTVVIKAEADKIPGKGTIRQPILCLAHLTCSYYILCIPGITFIFALRFWLT